MGVAARRGEDEFDEQRSEILRLLSRLSGTPSWRGSASAAALERRVGPVLGSDATPDVARPPPLRLRRRSTVPDVEDREARRRLAVRRQELDQLQRWRARLHGEAPEAALQAGFEGLGKRLHKLQSLPAPAPPGPAPAQAAAQPGAATAPAPAPAPAAPAAAQVQAGKVYAIAGTVESDMMADVLQLVSSNSMTGIFTVDTPEGSIQLFCEEGSFVHAAGQDLTAEAAFFAAFASEKGRYHFWETKDLPEERTITGSTQFLILEALRQIDEARGG